MAVWELSDQAQFPAHRRSVTGERRQQQIGAPFQARDILLLHAHQLRHALLSQVLGVPQIAQRHLLLNQLCGARSNGCARIRTHTGPGHSLPYASLCDVVSDDRFGTSFALIFYHQVVHVRGRNLGPVVDAIDAQRATLLTAYEPQAHDAPGEGTAVIEAVECEGSVGMNSEVRV